jgi:hypothetical protein
LIYSFTFFYIRIKTSIEHVNSLDDAKFKKLLQRIAEKTGRQVKYFILILLNNLFFIKNETIFTNDELNKLENAFGISIDDIKQMIETIEYMFLQSAYHLIKPQILENDLLNEQNFDENKVGFYFKGEFSYFIIKRLKYLLNNGQQVQKRLLNV